MQCVITIDLFVSNSGKRTIKIVTIWGIPILELITGMLLFMLYLYYCHEST